MGTSGATGGVTANGSRTLYGRRQHRNVSWIVDVRDVIWSRDKAR